MSFVVYAAVVLIAAASAMFGLDLLNAPLPQKPSTQVASTVSPNRLAQREADRKQEAAEAARADDRALTPVFPTNAAESKDVRMVYPPTNETTGAASADDKQPVPAEPKTAAVEPQQPQPSAVQPVSDELAAEAKADTPAVATPVTQQSSNRCDVSACAAAYSSFRESDCTYQPYNGSRRVCEKSSNSAQQRAADNPSRIRSAQSRRDVDLRDVEKRVRELTSARGDSNDDAAGAYDAPVRRRVIVIERGYGGPAFGRW